MVPTEGTLPKSSSKQTKIVRLVKRGTLRREPSHKPPDMRKVSALLGSLQLPPYLTWSWICLAVGQWKSAMQTCQLPTSAWDSQVTITGTGAWGTMNSFNTAVSESGFCMQTTGRGKFYHSTSSPPSAGDKAFSYSDCLAQEVLPFIGEPCPQSNGQPQARAFFRPLLCAAEGEDGGVQAPEVSREAGNSKSEHPARIQTEMQSMTQIDQMELCFAGLSSPLVTGSVTDLTPDASKLGFGEAILIAAS